MIKLEKYEVMGWEHAIRGMRNPMNSWKKSDSRWNPGGCNIECQCCDYIETCNILGENDKTLMMKLRNAGTDHRKFMRMITVYVDITAPLYWWKEFDTYVVGVCPNPTDVVKNSCSTMHKIHEKEFTIDDFSHEHLIDGSAINDEVVSDFDILDKAKPEGDLLAVSDTTGFLAQRVVFSNSSNVVNFYTPEQVLETFIIPVLNANREAYLKTKDKKYWWQMIQLLPSSYNQKRTIMLNYEVLANMYKSRKNHKLDEWGELCKWIEGLPYSELITGKEVE